MALNEYKAKIVRVVDGDTIIVDIDLGFKIHHNRTVRLFGVDAYETRLGKNTSPEQKVLGLKAKAYVMDILPEGTTVNLRSIEYSGKYGRCIADISWEIKKHKIVNLAELLIKEGFAIRKQY